MIIKSWTCLIIFASRQHILQYFLLKKIYVKNSSFNCLVTDWISTNAALVLGIINLFFTTTSLSTRDCITALNISTCSAKILKTSNRFNKWNQKLTCFKYSLLHCICYFTLSHSTIWSCNKFNTIVNDNSVQNILHNIKLHHNASRW